jgi:hypothetical protein
MQQPCLQAAKPEECFCSPEWSVTTAAEPSLEPFQARPQASGPSHRSIAVSAWQAYHHHSCSGEYCRGCRTPVLLCCCLWCQPGCSCCCCICMHCYRLLFVALHNLCRGLHEWVLAVFGCSSGMCLQAQACSCMRSGQSPAWLAPIQKRMQVVATTWVASSCGGCPFCWVGWWCVIQTMQLAASIQVACIAAAAAAGT